MAKRFKWRFESVKNAKDKEEERSQQELANAQNKLRSEEEKLADLQGRREVHVRRLRQKQTGRLNTADISVIHAYLEELSGQIQRQGRRVEEARVNVGHKREALLRTVQENKVLENLKERDNQAFRKTERRRDQARTDEIANRRATVRKRKDRP